jgi:hypothetical protein
MQVESLATTSVVATRHGQETENSTESSLALHARTERGVRHATIVDFHWPMRCIGQVVEWRTRIRELGELEGMADYIDGPLHDVSNLRVCPTIRNSVDLGICVRSQRRGRGGAPTDRRILILSGQRNLN